VYSRVLLPTYPLLDKIDETVVILTCLTSIYHPKSSCPVLPAQIEPVTCPSLAVARSNAPHAALPVAPQLHSGLNHTRSFGTPFCGVMRSSSAAYISKCGILRKYNRPVLAHREIKCGAEGARCRVACPTVAAKPICPGMLTGRKGPEGVSSENFQDVESRQMGNAKFVDCVTTPSTPLLSSHTGDTQQYLKVIKRCIHLEHVP